MNTTRRQVLQLGAGALAFTAFTGLKTANGQETDTTLDSLDDLQCVYVNNKTGTVELVKSFIDVNEEIKTNSTLQPYQAPTKNIYIATKPEQFKQDVKRYAIVDIAKRDEGLGFFSSLKGSYTPTEFTHHFMLSLADRELGRQELGEWALANATDAEKEQALEQLHKIHSGYNGALITGNAEKMKEAVWFYTARLLITPKLYIGKTPKVGDLALIGTQGIELVDNGYTQIAVATDGAVTGGMSVDGQAAVGVGAAADGATASVGAVAGAVGVSAGVGSSAGGAGTGSDGAGAGSSGGTGGSSGSSGGGSNGGAGGGNV